MNGTMEIESPILAICKTTFMYRQRQKCNMHTSSTSTSVTGSMLRCTVPRVVLLAATDLIAIDPNFFTS